MEDGGWKIIDFDSGDGLLSKTLLKEIKRQQNLSKSLDDLESTAGQIRKMIALGEQQKATLQLLTKIRHP
jgi:hypothetical protein